MIWPQMSRWRRADCGEGELEVIAAQLPDRCDIERLRSFGNPGLKLAGDAHQRLPGFAKVGMQSGERDRGLAGMLGTASDRGHQPRPAGNGLASRFGTGQTDKQTPPVLSQTDRPGKWVAPNGFCRE